MLDQTIITCENGHYIALHDGVLRPNAAVVAERFYALAEDVPSFVGGQVIESRCCPRCDGRVFDVIGPRVRVHTREGWKP